MHSDTKEYNAALAPGDRAIGKLLAERWLANARDVQWDYKNIVRRKGQLERLI